MDGDSALRVYFVLLFLLPFGCLAVLGLGLFFFLQMFQRSRSPARRGAADDD